jgi:hypothetical protein
VKGVLEGAGGKKGRSWKEGAGNREVAEGGRKGRQGGEGVDLV